MPWKVSNPVSERMRFIARLLDGERMSDVCRDFGITRKTGYKFKARYDQHGPEGLYEASRRPHGSPRTTDAITQEQIVAARKAHPTWGPAKLRHWLSEHNAGVLYPASSTIGEILRKRGLITPRKRRSRVPGHEAPLRDAKAPNDLWCVDYKGQFRMGNGEYCYPLTVTDQMSRMLIVCEGFERIQTETAQTAFEHAFAEYGLPFAIRSDNGAPFASRGLLGLSRLSAYWISLGIAVERIEPGHPEQNGRHERMHRTLKAETTRPAAKNLLQQQERFDAFVEEFNNDRPHEGLGQRTPGSIYQTSSRLRSSVPELAYPLHDDVRTVSGSGHLTLSRKTRIFLSTALAGHAVGLREIDDDLLLISFADRDLGCLNVKTNNFNAIEAESLDAEKVSPMSPV